MSANINTDQVKLACPCMGKEAEVVKQECTERQRKAKAVLRREVRRRERMEKSKAQKQDRK